MHYLIFSIHLTNLRRHKKNKLIDRKTELEQLILSAPAPQNGQTHSNNSSAKADEFLKVRRFIVKNFWILNICENEGSYENFGYEL